MEEFTTYWLTFVAEGKVCGGEDINVGVLSYFPFVIVQVKVSMVPDVPSFVEYLDHQGNPQRAQAKIGMKAIQEAIEYLGWWHDDLASGVWQVFKPKD